MAISKTSKYLVLILTAVIVALAGLTLAAVTVNQTLTSSGTITTGPNIGVFSDSACTNAVTSISWGSVEAGGSVSQTVYIENTGGTVVAPSISVSNWSPSNANTYISLAWSALPSSISPGVSSAVAVTLTLTVSSSITDITSFSNTITISGTG